MRFGKSELAGQMPAHDVAVEQRHGPTALLDELAVDDLRQRRLARTRQSSEEKRYSLPAARAVDLAQRVDHLRKREPLWNLFSPRKAPRQLLRVQVLMAHAGRLRVLDRHELPTRRHVCDLFVGYRLDTQLVSMALEQLLGGGRRIEPLPGTLPARRTAVVRPDHEVRATVVLRDDRMPQHFAGTRHAHGNWQQRQRRQAVGIVPPDSLIALHPRVVAQIPRPRLAHRRVEQNMRIDLPRSAHRELIVAPVHRLTGMAGDDAPPAHLGELMAQLLGTVTQLLVVVVSGQLHAFEGSADVIAPRLLVEVAHPWV